LVESMSFIAYLSGHFVLEFFQLRPDIVNSAPGGRIRTRKPFCCNKVR
jgi:hypothetical protein